MQERIAAFSDFFFFPAACKVSTTCDPDLQGMQCVDNDPTCKGMWGWASKEQKNRFIPMIH